MKTHKIGWLNVPGYIPQTWNPIVGCSKISDGCRNCYAERQAIRNYNCLTAARASSVDALATYEAYNCALSFKNNPAEQQTFGFDEAEWSGFTTANEPALEKPLGWKKPRAIFVNSMGDLFHESTPDEWVDRVFAVMALCPQHLFIVLTKRAERMEKYFVGWRGKVSPENMWLGVTAENQAAADERIPHLLRTPSAVRFVSIEPMVGAVTFRWKMAYLEAATGKKYRTLLQERGEINQYDALRCLDWVICGGESGPGARPLHGFHARLLMRECVAADVPFFFKQWGDKRTKENLLPVGENSSFNKRRGGDVLEGKQWHQFPTIGKAE